MSSMGVPIFGELVRDDAGRVAWIRVPGRMVPRAGQGSLELLRRIDYASRKNTEIAREGREQGCRRLTIMPSSAAVRAMVDPLAALDR